MPTLWLITVAAALAFFLCTSLYSSKPYNVSACWEIVNQSINFLLLYSPIMLMMVLMWSGCGTARPRHKSVCPLTAFVRILHLQQCTGPTHFTLLLLKIWVGTSSDADECIRRSNQLERMWRKETRFDGWWTTNDGRWWCMDGGI